jgi:hypothetical protein
VLLFTIYRNYTSRGRKRRHAASRVHQLGPTFHIQHPIYQHFQPLDLGNGGDSGLCGGIRRAGTLASRALLLRPGFIGLSSGFSLNTTLF